VSVPEPNLEEFDHLAEIAELRKALQNTQANLRKAQTRTEDLMRAAQDGAREALIALGSPPPVKPPKRDQRRVKPEVALLHLSDWQLGKVTESYNTEVALARIEQLGHKVVELTEIERAHHPVRECHIMLGGDLPENAGIFPGQGYEIDSGLFRQSSNCIGAVERLVRLQLSVFEKVHVWVVKGNHGRIGKKGEHPREDNADGFIAEQAYERLKFSADSSRLVWHDPKRWYAVVEVGNYHPLLIHGDQIKSFGGNLPAFGIVRKVNAWASGVIPGFKDDCYMGHFHQPMVLPMPVGSRRTFVNPSTESDSAYAQEFIAAQGSPGQRLNFVDPDKGRVTSERIVWLD
jgi:hypothetical protein